MKIVQHTVTVRRMPEEVWRFLVNLDRTRYIDWHPDDHIEFRRLRPALGVNGVGQAVYFKERIGNRVFGFSCVISKSNEAQYVEFKPRWPLRGLGLGRGYFRMRPAPNDSTELEAVVELGSPAPLIGPVVDALVERVIDLNALRRHMAEEGENLERALGPRRDSTQK